MSIRTDGVVCVLTVLLGVGVAMAGASTQPAAPVDAQPPAAVSPTTQPLASRPDPSLSPGDVVRAVVEALRTNDEHDSGIRTTWEFASPGNKQVTGPLERFIPLVKNPAYLPLLNDRTADYQAAQVQGDQAQEIVGITEFSGEKVLFAFRLSRQTDGPLKGCWMTDGVVPIQLHAAPGRPVPPAGDGSGHDLPV